MWLWRRWLFIGENKIKKEKVKEIDRIFSIFGSGIMLKQSQRDLTHTEPGGRGFKHTLVREERYVTDDCFEGQLEKYQSSFHCFTVKIRKRNTPTCSQSAKWMVTVNSLNVVWSNIKGT